MELISKQNNIFRKIEEIYKFDLVANEWTVIEKKIPIAISIPHLMN